MRELSLNNARGTYCLNARSTCPVVNVNFVKARAFSGIYRVIRNQGRSNSYISIVKHTAAGGFKKCVPAPALAPACKCVKAMSVVIDLWDRATKPKGKGKAKAPTCTKGNPKPKPKQKPTKKLTAKKPNRKPTKRPTKKPTVKNSQPKKPIVKKPTKAKKKSRKLET